MTRYGILLLVVVAACDQRDFTSASTGSGSQCQAIAQASPASLTIPVGGTGLIAATQEVNCPAPRFRNETPTLLQMDSVSASTFRVTGRVVGNGQVRIRAAVDTTVSQIVSVTVTP